MAMTNRLPKIGDLLQITDMTHTGIKIQWIKAMRDKAGYYHNGDGIWTSKLRLGHVKEMSEQEGDLAFVISVERRAGPYTRGIWCHLRFMRAGLIKSVQFLCSDGSKEIKPFWTIL
jgi:hypothetical protein